MRKFDGMVRLESCELWSGVAFARCAMCARGIVIYPLCFHVCLVEAEIC